MAREEVKLKNYSLEHCALHLLKKKVPVYSLKRQQQRSGAFPGESLNYQLLRVEVLCDLQHKLNLILTTLENSKLYGITPRNSARG